MNRLIKEINDTVMEPGSLNIWWIGQEGYVIKSPDLVIYIDPYLSTYAEQITRGKPNEHVRMMQPPMRPEEVPMLISYCARTITLITSIRKVSRS